MGKGGKPGGGRGTLVPFPSGAGNDIELKRADGVDVTLKLPSGEEYSLRAIWKLIILLTRLLLFYQICSGPKKMSQTEVNKCFDCIAAV